MRDERRVDDRRQAASAPVGQDLHLAIFSEADALRADALLFVQVDVNHPAVGGRHRFQLDAASGLPHPAGDPVGHLPQAVLPPLPVLFYVQRQPHILAGQPLAHDALHDELQRLQGLAAPPDEQPGIGAADVNNRPAGEFVILGAQGSGYFRPHAGENDLQGRYGYFGRRSRRQSGRGGRRAFIRRNRIRHGVSVDSDGVCRLGFRFRGRFVRGGGGQPGDADFGRFAADAQETLPAPI